MQNLLNFIQHNQNTLKPFGIFALSIIGIYGNYNFLQKKQKGINLAFNQSNQEQDQQQNYGKNNKKPAGIMNQGNTCFVNSLLQSLASLQTFNKNIQELLKVKSISDSNQQFIVQLNNVIKKINKNKTQNQSISVMKLLNLFTEVMQNNLINFQQQDAYQLYSSIVRLFDQFFNKRKQVNLSFMSSIKIKQNDNQQSQNQMQEQIQNSLMGYTKSTIQCMVCRNTVFKLIYFNIYLQTTIKIQPFYDLSLQIQPNFINSLRNALLWYQREQNIQNYACTSCSIKSHIQKLEKIQNLLTFQNHQWKQDLIIVRNTIINYLKKNRFEDCELKEINQSLERNVSQFSQIFHKIGNDTYRNTIFSLIKPVQRDIIKQTKITKYPKILVIHFKQLIINPYNGELAYMRKPIDYPLTLQIDQSTIHSPRKKVYKLTSALTHIGNQMMGHYFVFRKNNRFDQSWFMISDTHTEQSNQYKMKRYPPYMLFYQLHQDQIYNRSLNMSIMKKENVQQNQIKQKILNSGKKYENMNNENQN